MKKLSFVSIAFLIFNSVQGQTTPRRTQSDSSKTRNSKSTNSQHQNNQHQNNQHQNNQYQNNQHQNSRRDSTRSPKGYYKQPKDVIGKDSNKVGATPR
jgi:hypothetical protein